MQSSEDMATPQKRPWGMMTNNVMGQRSAGEALTRSGSLVVQRKMTLGEAGDAYEDEADCIAKQVVSQINTPGFSKDNFG